MTTDFLRKTFTQQEADSEIPNPTNQGRVDGATILGSAPELQNNFGKIEMGNEVETYLYRFMPLCFQCFFPTARTHSP